MVKDPEQLAHQEWLGYVQPIGLVVSIPALLAAQAHINRNIVSDHQRFLNCLARDDHDQLIPELRDFAEFAEKVLGWRKSDLARVRAGDSQYASIEVPLPEYNETLRPTHVVREIEPDDPEHPWMMLIQVLPADTPLDDATDTKDQTWHAAPQARFERLLRETRVPIGLLCNSAQIRLVYAPRGETSGYATFSVAEMAQVAGRPIFAALHMLLCAERLFSLGKEQRLPAILADSRKYQNVVSTQLAEQVLAALYELVRGFQAADDQSKGDLLRQVLAENPNHVYQGLLTVLMRLVFVLYAEDRGLLSSDPVFANYYSLTGLFERLRADDGRYPDTMDQRYGAWAQLLTLFRLIYGGGGHGALRIPPRHGYLFDPDRYNFLEGRPWQTSRQHYGGEVQVPRISDGVIFRVLNNLLILDGERLSYRTLDVEQIGSVYETMMGFDLHVAEGRSIAVKSKKSNGAPTTINLETLLQVKASDRGKWLKENAEQDLTGQAFAALKGAETIDDLVAALDKKIAKSVTRNSVTVAAKGAMILQPSDERRRSGSHYTPRSLTEPIVRTTLKPILEQLGARPSPDQLLALKVCDPAMGSGAFLVEACRQLGDELVRAWHIHKCPPKLPPDEDELLHARRLIAQHCLYGVDKNPMAVDLSKLSLWLATLAKDHPFTFLDHSLRTGDSLVGLTQEQIAAFHWKPPVKRKDDEPWFGDPIAAKMKTVTEYRQRILAARDDKPYEQLRQELDVADEALSLARLTGDCVISAYFSVPKDKDREKTLNGLARQMVKYVGVKGEMKDRQPLTEAVALLQCGEHPLQPFHWHIEFPEVFTVDRQRNPRGGFDVIVGNPPFAGHVTITTANAEGYTDYLRRTFEHSGGKCDLVAFFFRRAFTLLRAGGTFGLLATKTIRQGDTRESGLKWICKNDGYIYQALRRYMWPGQASVQVSIIHVSKGRNDIPRVLDGKPVNHITSYLFANGGDDSPVALHANERKSFEGSVIRGMGFTFDDNDKKGVANSIEMMTRLVAQDHRNQELIFPYIGGADVNESPTHSASRYIINFGGMEEADAKKWPDLFAIAKDKVLTARLSSKAKSSGGKIIEKFWQYGHLAKDLYDSIRGMDRILACGQTSKYRTFTFLPNGMVYDQKLIIFPFRDYSYFAVMQSQPHVYWAVFFGSTLEDRPVYTPTDCFDPFPFPVAGYEELEGVGEHCFLMRADLMVKNNEGLTDTYNRFHDPDERSPDIVKLRELHAAMDRAVLEAYGWHDLAQTATYKFVLDYEDDEDDDESLSGKKSKKKKPWRYRWLDEYRDEVLARLLDLNKHRAQEERLSGEAAPAKQITSAKAPQPRPKKSRTRGSETATLFDALDPE